MKDELLKDPQIKRIKINYNIDNKNFLLIQHQTNMDKILEPILKRWGNKYDIVSASGNTVVFKEK